MNTGFASIPELSFLKKAFFKFHENIEQYIDEMNGSELPYYFNERATISIFSAACWQSDMIAIDEYITVKNKSGSNDASKGRGDLWCRAKDGNSVGIEAKQYTGLYNKGKIINSIEKSQKDAQNCTQSYIESGLAFIVPAINEKDTYEDFLGNVRRIHDDALNFGVDLIAWWGSKTAFKVCQRSRYEKDDGYYRWPGIISIMRIGKACDDQNKDVSYDHLPACLPFA